jgi:hypothetical protein
MFYSFFLLSNLRNRNSSWDYGDPWANYTSLQNQTRGQYAIAVGKPGTINTANLIRMCSGRVKGETSYITTAGYEPIQLSGDQSHVVTLANYMEVVQMIQPACQPLSPTTTTTPVPPPQSGVDVLFVMSTGFRVEAIQDMVSLKFKL